MNELLYHYILVRKDIPIETQMVSIAHGAGESIKVAPIPSTTICVLLYVDNEKQLLEYEKLIIAKGFDYVVIREPDEPWNNQAMSIGLTPSIKRNQLRKLFYHLELVKIGEPLEIDSDKRHTQPIG